MRKQHAEAGFTLVELMVVVSIMAIMAAIALPNMSRWVASQRLQNRADQVVSLFQFARAEAIRLNLPVVACPTTIKANTGDSNTCIDFASGNNTLQGMIVWKDINRNNAFASGQTLRAVALNQNGTDSKIQSQFAAYNNAATAVNNITRIGFMPGGMMGLYNGSTWSFGTGYVLLTMTDAKDNTLVRKVLVYPSGNSIVCNANSPQSSYCNL